MTLTISFVEFEFTIFQTLVHEFKIGDDPEAHDA